MKKLLILVIIGAVFALTALPALAALDTGLNYGDYSGLGTKDVREGIMSIIRILLGFLGVIAIIGIVAGGFLMMTAGGNAERSDTGRKAVAAGVIGLVIIFTAYAIAIFAIEQLITATI